MPQQQIVRISRSGFVEFAVVDPCGRPKLARPSQNHTRVIRQIHGKNKEEEEACFKCEFPECGACLPESEMRALDLAHTKGQTLPLCPRHAKMAEERGKKIISLTEAIDGMMGEKRADEFFGQFA